MQHQANHYEAHQHAAPSVTDAEHRLRKGRRALAAVWLVGSLFVAAGLYSSKDASPPQWRQLNAQLATTVAELELAGSTAAVVAAADSTAGAAVAAPAAPAAPVAAPPVAAAPAAPAPETPVVPAAPEVDALPGEIVNEAVTTPEPAAQSPHPEAVFGKIDINRVTADQLQQLPGIGPAKAQAIISEREQSGRFTDVYDLVRVKGIGAKTVEKLKDSIVVLP